MSSRLRPTEKIRSDKEIREFGVHFVWDFEYKLVEKTDPESLNNLLKNIEKSLKTLDSRYFIYGTPIGYGKVKDDNRYLVNELRARGFQMNTVETKTVICATCGDLIRQSKYFPNDDVYERKTDVADIQIVKHMVFHAIGATIKRNMPRNILLVSSDQDFGCTFTDLSERGFTVMAAIDGTTYDMYGGICGNHTWLWKQMQKGGSYIKRI